MEPQGELILCLGPPGAQSFQQLFLIRRQDKNIDHRCADRFIAVLSNLFRTLNVDVDEHVVTFPEASHDLAFEGAVELTMDLGVLEKLLLLDPIFEFLPAQKEIVGPVDFPFPGGAGRCGDGVIGNVVLVGESMAKGCFPGTRGAGNHAKQAKTLKFGWIQEITSGMRRDATREFPQTQRGITPVEGCQFRTQVITSGSSSMIEVSGLTKRYVGHTAVDDVSFKVSKGEIVGFLGPNGAGKSTTIRMMTCFLTPTAGTATIDGFDIEKDSIKVRQRIGYMPENVPLYHDMRVTEFLRFRGSLKGITAKKLGSRVDEVIDKCSLGDVQNKIIATLSKGYRQRVGLADALVGDPELLILDEPTNGLDPQQIRHFRELIKELGKEHTIFLSTHILPEVEKTCNRILIINRGKLKASDTPQNLVQRRREGSDIVLEIKANPKEARPLIKKVKRVGKVKEETAPKGWARFLVSADRNVDLSEQLFDLAVENQWKVRELSRRNASLEDAFVDLVKRDIAEEADES